MRFDTALQIHLEQLKRLNARPNTIRHHYYRLQHFGRFLQAEGVTDIGAVTTSIVNRFPSYLYKLRTLNKPLGVRTQAYDIQLVQLFFDSLIERELIVVRPTQHLPRLRIPVRMPPRIPTAVDVERMLGGMKTDTAKRFRDRTMFELFYATGMRNDELRSLTPDLFDREHRLLHVTGKGLKDRALPLTNRAFEILVEYLDNVRPLLPKCRFIFPNRYGKRLSNTSILEFLHERTKAADIRQRLTTHTFRHVLGTELLRNGADLRAIQEYLGHARVQTTTIYARVLGRDLKAVHSKTHPREKGRRKRQWICG